MSSSRLLVHIAENGHTFEVDCDEATPVEAVMRFIESVSHVDTNDQLVLCLDMKLDPHRPLSFYKLPSPDDSHNLFIFNKARLQPNSPPPPPEHLDHHAIDLADPPPSSPSQPPRHPLDDAADPALKALPSYEREFRVHYHKGHVIYSRTQRKYDNCERLLREQKVQQRAVEVARGNLDQYYRMINQNYAEFMKRYTHQYRVHSDILANLGRDLEKLRSFKLHPALQSANRKCLSDFVKDETVRNGGETCTHSHKQFENKVSQFNKMFSEVKQKVEELFVSTTSLPIKNLELTIKEHQRYLSEQKSIMQSLSKDVNTVKKLVDDCLSSQLSSSLRPHDAVSALGPMYDVHDKNHLPRMQACENAISKLLDYCKDKKNEMNMFLHNYMQKITYISYIIKDAKLQFPVFKEAMVRQDDLFYELKLVRGIGPAYRACLAEIVRRKASLKLYMGMAGQLAERLATKREAEVRRREEFLKVHSSYMPRDVLASMGLYDTPNQCDVNIAPFDTCLLDIDISDLDRYAPEYLAGLSSKGSFRGSSSMSNESSHSAEVDELTGDNIEKCDSEELLEGCELVQIAGTSKMEVENAKLKAELASAVAVICSFWPDADFESLDDSKMDNLLKDAAAKTAEALHLKDEYAKHLKSMLSTKQLQCLSYEKRIQELEHRLSDQYLQGQKLKNDKDGSDGKDLTACLSNTVPMDEVSCISNSLDAKLGLFNERGDKVGDGADENMMDSSAVHNHQMDSSMQEIGCEELLVSGKDGKEKMVGQLVTSLAHSSTDESKPEHLNVSHSETTLDPGFGPKVSTELLFELETLLKNKSNQLNETETNLKAAMEEAAMLKRELDTNLKLLDESQMNCAHLENSLHEAREEAQTHLCAADRRASEYSALRASAVKMRGLFERLRSCVNAQGMNCFIESLRGLAQSLGNSINENEDDGTLEFRKCIRVLSDRVGFLSRHREELLDKYPKVEAANEQLRKEMEEKKELVKTLYTKHQLEKQANKEKISFGRMEVHEIAAFVLNATGHYEAINKNCSNYYLSAESVALFTDHLPHQPNYIVGQIVHIERQIVKPSGPISVQLEDELTSDTGNDHLALNAGSNPYGLPVGCEYFIATVAMLPDTIHSPP